MKFIKLFFIITVTLLLSCSKFDGDSLQPQGNGNAIEVTFNVDGYTAQNLTRSGSADAFDSKLFHIHILVFDAVSKDIVEAVRVDDVVIGEVTRVVLKQYLSKVELYAISNYTDEIVAGLKTVSDMKPLINVKMSSTTTSYASVDNHMPIDAQVSDENTVLEKGKDSALMPLYTESPLFLDEIKIENDSPETLVFTLNRDYARIDIKLSDALTDKILHKGYIANARDNNMGDDSVLETNMLCRAEDSYVAAEVGGRLIEGLYLFATPVDQKTYVIFSANHPDTGFEVFYKLMLRYKSDELNEEYDLFQVKAAHKYILEITDIKADGYHTYKEALENLPSNSQIDYDIFIDEGNSGWDTTIDNGDYYISTSNDEFVFPGYGAQTHNVVDFLYGENPDKRDAETTTEYGLINFAELNRSITFTYTGVDGEEYILYAGDDMPSNASALSHSLYNYGTTTDIDTSFYLSTNGEKYEDSRIRVFLNIPDKFDKEGKLHIRIGDILKTIVIRRMPGIPPLSHRFEDYSDAQHKSVVIEQVLDEDNKIVASDLSWITTSIYDSASKTYTPSPHQSASSAEGQIAIDVSSFTRSPLDTRCAYIYYNQSEDGIEGSRTKIYYEQAKAVYRKLNNISGGEIGIDWGSPYVGAFWRASEVGERVIRIRSLGSIEVTDYSLSSNHQGTNAFYTGHYTKTGSVLSSEYGDQAILAMPFGAWGVEVDPNSGDLANDVFVTKYPDSYPQLAYQEYDVDDKYSIKNGVATVFERIPGNAEDVKFEDSEKLKSLIGTENVMFRIGLNSAFTPSESTPARYAVLRLYWGDYKFYTNIYLRQGENPDYVMRPEDGDVWPDGSRHSAADDSVFGGPASRPRKNAKKWSVYNLTSSELSTVHSDGVRYANPAGQHNVDVGGAIFVDYPTMAGAYWKLHTKSEEKGRYAFGVYSDVQQAGYDRSHDASYDFYHFGTWNDYKDDIDVTPKNYYLKGTRYDFTRPQHGGLDKHLVGSSWGQFSFAKSESDFVSSFSSTFVDNWDGRVATTESSYGSGDNVEGIYPGDNSRYDSKKESSTSENAYYGCYADGFYDRQALLVDTSSDHIFACVHPDYRTEKLLRNYAVAHPGILYYNPITNASLFLPSSGLIGFDGKIDKGLTGFYTHPGITVLAYSSSTRYVTSSYSYHRSVIFMRNFLSSFNPKVTYMLGMSVACPIRPVVEEPAMVNPYPDPEPPGAGFEDLEGGTWF